MIDILADYEIGPLFQPPLHRGNADELKGSLWCPGDIGGVNIDGPAAADPESGILYVTSRKHCTTRVIAPGSERDAILELPTGTTVADYAVLSGFGVRGPDGLPMFKPPYNRITAIDMNTGEHLWFIPVGETPDIVLEPSRPAGHGHTEHRLRLDGRANGRHEDAPYLRRQRQRRHAVRLRRRQGDRRAHRQGRSTGRSTATA